jgi:hypothetical protein
MKRSIARIKSSFQGLRDRLKRSRKRRTRRNKARTRKARTRRARTRKALTRSHRGGYDGVSGEISGGMKPASGG